MRAAAALGPKTETPNRRSASARPRTSGTSGPTTTRSTSSERESPRRPSASSARRGWHCESPRCRGCRVPRAAPRGAATARASRPAHAHGRPSRRRGPAPRESTSEPPGSAVSRTQGRARAPLPSRRASPTRRAPLGEHVGRREAGSFSSIGASHPESTSNTGRQWWKSLSRAGKSSVSLPLGRRYWTQTGARRTPTGRRAS